MIPSAAQIFSNRFIAENLEISFETTKVRWNGVVNLKNLKAPLNELIELGRTFIEVYPD